MHNIVYIWIVVVALFGIWWRKILATYGQCIAIPLLGDCWAETILAALLLLLLMLYDILHVTDRRIDFIITINLALRVVVLSICTLCIIGALMYFSFL